MHRLPMSLALFVLSLVAPSSFAVSVVQTTPVNGARACPDNQSVIVDFSESMNTGTVTSARFFLVSRQRGYKAGTITFNGGWSQTVFWQYTFFGVGDFMTAELARGIYNTNNTAELPFRAWKFHIGSHTNGGEFAELDNPYLYGVQMPRLGDLDGDGDLDCMVAAGNGSYSNVVMINNGSGVFSLGQRIGPLVDTRFVLGDLDRDGDLDAVLLGNDYSTYTNQMWTNNGEAVFSKAYDIVNASPSAGCIEDLNGDGWLDLVLVVQASGAYILTNNLSGRLVDSGQRLAGMNPQGGAVGDLNGDGFPDILMGSYGNGVYVFTNNGRGVFGPYGSLGSESCKPLALGDVDGDNDLDVIATTGSIKVFTNNGVAQFSDSGQTLGAYSHAELADMNGDGNLDIVTPGYLYTNNGLGVFSQSSVSFGGNVGLDVGDVDNDGYVDVMVSQNTGFGESAVWKNLVPNLLALGTNGAVIYTGYAASTTNGTDFGSIPTGSTLARTFTITNAGPAALIISGVSTSGSPLFTVAGLPATVSPYSVSNVTITFAPTAPGTANATLTLVNNGRVTPYQIKLAGSGAASIDASAGAHGSITPTGLVQVAAGESTSFVITADSYYWIDSLLTNGAADAAAAHARVYTSWWNSVAANGTVSVSFAEAFAAHGTPELWLAQYGWTNDFDTWETADTDVDDMKAWEEYIAGTDPTNRESFFQCLEISSENLPTLGKLLRWNAVSGRVYSIDGSTNLPGDWFGLATNLPPVGVWTDTTHGADQLINYRLGVQKP